MSPLPNSNIYIELKIPAWIKFKQKLLYFKSNVCNNGQPRCLRSLAFCCCHHENTRAQDHCSDLQLWKDGLHRSQEVRLQLNFILFFLQKRGGKVFLLYFTNIWLLPWALDDIYLSSEEQSRLAARKYARVVQKLGFPAKFLDFKIQNMVGSCDVKFPIRLEGLVLTHQQFSR